MNPSPGPGVSKDQSWPSLPLDAWRETYATLHMWTQIVGKIRLTLAVLSYDDVRNSASPRDTLLQFLQSTYEAGANLAQWDRGALERTTK
jgi:hypothetical protein